MIVQKEDLLAKDDLLAQLQEAKRRGKPVAVV
jgi:hypothetical protein